MSDRELFGEDAIKSDDLLTEYTGNRIIGRDATRLLCSFDYHNEGVERFQIFQQIARDTSDHGVVDPRNCGKGTPFSITVISKNICYRKLAKVLTVFIYVNELVDMAPGTEATIDYWKTRAGKLRRIPLNCRCGSYQ